MFPSIELGATRRNPGIGCLDKVDPKTRVRIEAGAGILAVDYARMTRARQAAIESFENLLYENEVLIVPTAPIRAPLLSSIESDVGFHEANGLVLRNPRVANLLDCPAISLSIPIDGLPVGLKSDRRLLEIASCIEAMLQDD